MQSDILRLWVAYGDLNLKLYRALKVTIWPSKSVDVVSGSFYATGSRVLFVPHIHKNSAYNSREAMTNGRNKTVKNTVHTACRAWYLFALSSELVILGRSASWIICYFTNVFLTFKPKCIEWYSLIWVQHWKTSVMPTRSCRANDNNFTVLIRWHYTNHISFYMIYEQTLQRGTSTLSLV